MNENLLTFEVYEHPSYLLGQISAPSIPDAWEKAIRLFGGSVGYLVVMK